MKRPLDDILKDLPNVADKHISVPEISIGGDKKVRGKKKKRGWMYALSGLAAALAVMIYVFMPFKDVSAEIIDNGFNPPEDKIVLEASPKDEERLRKVLDAVVKVRYPDKEFENYEIQSVALASQSTGGWKDIVKANTSEKVYQNTWIVQLYFPDMAKVSASMSQGQLFIARTKTGWVVWSQYH
jgi:hypothetical protein